MSSLNYTAIFRNIKGELRKTSIRQASTNTCCILSIVDFIDLKKLLNQHEQSLTPGYLKLLEITKQVTKLKDSRIFTKKQMLLKYE